MVLFADGGTGLFFNEWYWDAIFGALSAAAGARARGGPHGCRPADPAHAAAAGRDAPAIHAFYSMTGNGWASVTQERPPGDRRTRYSRDCLLEGAGDPCREVRSSKGIRVMVAKDGALSVEASALLGGTLVNVIGDRLTEPDVLAYIDALRPTDPDDLEFKRG